MSDLHLHHPKRTVQRLDYHALNDGSDSEAETADQIEPSPKRPHLAIASLQQDMDQFIHPALLTLNESTSSTIDQSIQPKDSISQVMREKSSYIDQETWAIPIKTTKEPAWIWSQYVLDIIPESWIPPRQKKAVSDQAVRCARCSWSTRMSQLKTATSNLWIHLKTQHKDVLLPVRPIYSSSTVSAIKTQPSIIESFGKQKEKDIVKIFEHNLLQWIVAENIPFDAIESPFFSEDDQ